MARKVHEYAPSTMHYIHVYNHVFILHYLSHVTVGLPHKTCHRSCFLHLTLCHCVVNIYLYLQTTCVHTGVFTNTLNLHVVRNHLSMEIHTATCGVQILYILDAHCRTITYTGNHYDINIFLEKKNEYE